MDPHQTLQYWSSKPPHITSMLLNLEAQSLDPLERKEIFEILPSVKDKEVLELGAGIGRFTNEFTQRAKMTVAIDFCEHFTRENQKRNSRAQCITMNAREASFPPSTFDMVFMVGFLMYLKDEEVKELFKKIKTWLKPEGYLFFRESCAALTHNSETPGYPARYRSLLSYDALVQEYKILKTNHLKTYERFAADPFKCYWLCQKV